MDQGSLGLLMTPDTLSYSIFHFKDLIGQKNSTLEKSLLGFANLNALVLDAWIAVCKKKVFCWPQNLAANLWALFLRWLVVSVISTLSGEMMAEVALL